MIVHYENAKEMLEDFRLRSLIYPNGYLFFREEKGRFSFTL